MMSALSTVFVVSGMTIDNPVIRSQVLSKASFLNSIGHRCLAVGAVRDASSKDEMQRTLSERYGVQVKVVASYSDRLGMFSIAGTAQKIWREAKAQIADFDVSSIYVRTSLDAILASRVVRSTSTRLIYDVRSARPEEIAMRRGPNSLRFRLGLEAEKMAQRNADRIGVVSENLRGYVNDLVGRDDAIVIPSCVDENTIFFDAELREKYRENLGVASDELLMCYSGGADIWQQLPRTLKLCLTIANRIPKTKFLFLVRNPEAMMEIARGYDLPANRFYFRSSPFEEMRGYLSASDVGVLLRQESVVNSVASPIKLGEYLVCGLNLVVSRGIGSVGDRLVADNVGLLIGDTQSASEEVIEYLGPLLEQRDRDSCIALGKQLFTHGAFRSQYQQLFA